MAAKKDAVTILCGSAPGPGDKGVTYEFGTEAELDAFIVNAGQIPGQRGGVKAGHC